MNEIVQNITVKANKKTAFHKFVNAFNEWWPKAYTWSQDKLEAIRIEPKVNGLCTETGPHGFRCDWGRVLDITENQSIHFKWQISPQREPVPDPDRASDVLVIFSEAEGSATQVELVHRNFQNHGDGADKYRKMMDSEYGWAYILEQYKAYCENE